MLARADDVIELRMTMSAFGTKRTFGSQIRPRSNSIVSKVQGVCMEELMRVQDTGTVPLAVS